MGIGCAGGTISCTGGTCSCTVQAVGIPGGGWGAGGGAGGPPSAMFTYAKKYVDNILILIQILSSIYIILAVFIHVGNASIYSTIVILKWHVRGPKGLIKISGSPLVL